MTDEKIFSLANAWENFKQINDARLKEIERKGQADPLFEEHLQNIGETIDGHKSQLGQIGNAAQSLLGDADEYSRSFRIYLRKGMDAGLQMMHQMASASDDEGGYPVTKEMAGRITQLLFESSPMRQVAAVETISSESLDLIDDHQGSTAIWTAETNTVVDTSTPKLRKRSIPAHEIYAQPKATQKLVDDSSLDIEAWLSAKIADIFSRTQNTAFFSGTGVGQPRGILTFAAGLNHGQIQQINSGVAGQVTADGLINLFYSLKEGFARRSSFLMNRTTAQQARLLKQVTTGQYLWQPGLSAGAPDTVMGVPTYSTEDMPIPTTNSLSVALGDFRSAYQIVDRRGIRTLRDPFTEKPFVKFYATARVGGDVVNSDAIKLLKLAA